MTWLDRILATPTIGFEFDTWMLSGNDILSAVRPMLERRITGNELELSTPSVVSLKVGSSDGFTFDVTHNNVITTFSYKSAVVDKPGGVPQLEYKVGLQPYSKLLDKASSEIANLSEHLLRHKPRMMSRAGIVAVCRIALDASPPGLTAFIDHINRPWGVTSGSKMNVNVMAPLSKTSDYGDRCHHILDVNEIERSGDVRLTLDWQRVFEPRRQVRAEDITRDVDVWAKAALDYFERFGAGDLDYGNS